MTDGLLEFIKEQDSEKDKFTFLYFRLKATFVNTLSNIL